MSFKKQILIKGKDEAGRIALLAREPSDEIAELMDVYKRSIFSVEPPLTKLFVYCRIRRDHGTMNDLSLVSVAFYHDIVVNILDTEFG